MASTGKSFVSLVSPVDSRPKAAFFGSGSGITGIRDQFTISTWLSLGALLQGALFLALGRISLLPAFLLITYRLFKTYLITTGYLPNPYMTDVIPTKFSAQIPKPDGTFGSQPADSPIVVFLIGTRCNHPLGFLAPGMKELGDYFVSMTKELDARADEFGFLGMTSWINASDRSTSNGVLEVAYFRNVQGLQAYAHSELHRKAWDWWNKTVKDHAHLEIYHETYQVPAGGWENIYVNSHHEGMAGTTFKAKDEKTGEVKWVSPIVDARKGVLASSAGRMGRTAMDFEKYEVDNVY